MVLFGESLEGLMFPGWENYYIKYNDLKKIVAVAMQAETLEEKAEASDSFYNTLMVQTAGVNEFVKLQQDSLAKRLKTAKDTQLQVELPDLTASQPEEVTLGAALTELRNRSPDEPTLAAIKYLKHLTDLGRCWVNLRRFVGTNVIAATKIVKKHDKNVPPALAKRVQVSAAIKDMPFVKSNALLSLCEETNSLIAAVLKKLYPNFKEEEQPRDSVVDEETHKLRDMPTWLLAGAALDQSDVTVHIADEKDEDTTRFVKTFLSDWKLKKTTYEDGADDALSQTKKEEPDVWDVDFEDGTGKPWAEHTCGEKLKSFSWGFIRVVLIFMFLYFFICSLSFLADGFRLVAGKQAGAVFANSSIFNNPVAGLMVGIFVTVLVQSSSTSTSIIITMVGADLLTVEQAIPIVMGANIGTSVTSTLVALGHGNDRNEFRRAFAAATVHDMFNFLTVLVLLPLEVVFHPLYHIATGIVNSYPSLSSTEKPEDMLKKLTSPFTKFIIQLDSKMINKMSLAGTLSAAEREALESKSIMKSPGVTIKDGEEVVTEYAFDFMYGNWTDSAAGVFMLVFSVVILCICLMAIVKLLKSLLQGKVAVWLHRVVNGNVPDLHLSSARDGERSEGGCIIPMGWISGYLAMAMGMGLTILVQSSSITTSALTPLVGVGVIKLERMYPTVLGANLGTTVTGILAALAADGSALQHTLAVAFAHLFFNILGTILFYVIWPLRACPIDLARKLGDTTATYRWFPFLYILLAFFLIPAVFVVISLYSMAATVVLFAIMVLGAVFIAGVNYMQSDSPDSLPICLRTWDWLPLCMRSFAPLDRVCCGALERRCLKQQVPVGPKSGRSAPEADDIKKATDRLNRGDSTPVAQVPQSAATEETKLMD